MNLQMNFASKVELGTGQITALPSTAYRMQYKMHKWIAEKLTSELDKTRLAVLHNPCFTKIYVCHIITAKSQR